MTRSSGQPGFPPPRSQSREPDPRQDASQNFDPWSQPAHLAGGAGPNTGYGQQPAYPGHPAADPYAQGQYQQPDPYAQQGWAADGRGQHWAANPPAAPQWPASPQPDPLTGDGYHYPTSAEQGSMAAPAPTARSAYAPQFDSYVPPSQPGHARAAPQPSVAPHAPSQAQVAPDLRGAMFDDWRGETTAGGRARTSAPAPNAYGGQAGYPADPYAQGAFAKPPHPNGAAQGHGQDWAHHDPYAGHPGQPHGGYGGAPVYADPAAQHAHGYGAPQGQAMAVHPDYDDEEYEDEDVVEEPRRSSRMLLIAGALVGAIVVGGGLAYGYKMLVGPEAEVAGGAPVVRGGADPTKTRPIDPGGRKFEHADSKILGRLGGQGQVNEDASGTKRVPTMVVGRDGSIQEAPQAQAPAFPPPSDPVVSVPGLTVVDGFAGRRAAQPAPPPSALGGPVVVTPPARQPQQAEQPPVVLTRNADAAEPPAPKAPQRPVTQDKPPSAAAKPAVEPKPSAPPQRQAAAAVIPAFETRATPAPGTVAAGSGAGFVVVLASVPVSETSRMDSLRQFANMQQRYGSLLTAKAPEVRETNVANKGKYHRLLVGPPASKASASALCEGLKSAGYPSCWITPY